MNYIDFSTELYYEVANYIEKLPKANNRTFPTTLFITPEKIEIMKTNGYVVKRFQCDVPKRDSSIPNEDTFISLDVLPLFQKKLEGVVTLSWDDEEVVVTLKNGTKVVTEHRIERTNMGNEASIRNVLEEAKQGGQVETDKCVIGLNPRWVKVLFNGLSAKYDLVKFTVRSPRLPVHFQFQSGFDGVVAPISLGK